jgi:WD40 repeat protein
MDTERHRSRRKAPIRLLFCLAILSGLVLIIQNPALITRPSARFVGQVAFSPDGKTLAWTSESEREGRVAVWDLNHRRQRRLIGPRDSEPDRGAVSRYTSLAFSPDGRTIATGTGSTPDPDPRIILWDCETGRSQQILRGHSDAVSAVAFAPDGKTLASASRDRTVKLWDVALARARATLSVEHVPVSSMAFSPTGRLLATGWADRRVRVWDVSSGQLSAALPGHTQAVACVAFSPDGRTLASAGFDNTLKFWDLQTGRERSTYGGFPNTCRSILFSPDGKTLALKFAETSTGVLWDVDAGRLRATFGDAAAGLAFAPHGNLLAVAGGAQGRVFLVGTAPAGPLPGPVRTNPN